MTKFRWLAATAVALIAVPLSGAPTGTFSPQRLSAIDKFISSDAFEGREPGTRAGGDQVTPTFIHIAV